eukprot:UN03827
MWTTKFARKYSLSSLCKHSHACSMECLSRFYVNHKEEFAKGYGHDFLLTQSTRLSGPFKYLEHVRQANRKFSRGL